jgi:hypothetical protein
MPDKRRKDGEGCLRCWQNKMKHGCPQAQRWLKKHPEYAKAEAYGSLIVRGAETEYKQKTFYERKEDMKFIQ